MKRVILSRSHLVNYMKRVSSTSYSVNSTGAQKRCYCQMLEKAGEARDISVTGTPNINLGILSKYAGMFYIDTLEICKKLKAAGFNEDQSEAVAKLLMDILNASVENITKNMVTKAQQEIMVQQMLAQLASVKKDMIILEKSEFLMIRNDTEKQGIYIKQLEAQLSDSVKKLEGQVRLDINLEKSRAIEAHAHNEKNLQSLLNRLEIEHATNEKNLKALENKIDIEVSNLRTQNEKNRNDIQKYLIGLVFSVASAVFAYMRLVS